MHIPEAAKKAVFAKYPKLKPDDVAVGLHDPLIARLGESTVLVVGVSGGNPPANDATFDCTVSFKITPGIKGAAPQLTLLQRGSRSACETLLLLRRVRRGVEGLIERRAALAAIGFPQILVPLALLPPDHCRSHQVSQPPPLGTPRLPLLPGDAALRFDVDL